MGLKFVVPVIRLLIDLLKAFGPHGRPDRTQHFPIRREGKIAGEVDRRSGGTLYCTGEPQGQARLEGAVERALKIWRNNR